MHSELPEELTALRETVARFARTEIAPFAREWDRAGGFPDAIIPKLAALGLLGIHVPPEYGGAGGSYLAFAVALEELARHDGGVALAVEAHNGLCCEHLLRAGTEAQKQAFLPDLAAGNHLGSWCLTEPGSGSDAARMRTRAAREGGHWVLHGHKQFITNGSRAGLFVVLAVTAPERGRDGISAFLVERDRPGLTTGPREEKHGMHSSDTVAVHLDGVRVPGSHLLGAEGRGFQDAKRILEAGRLIVSALSLGLARGALEESVRYACERRAFGKPIVEHQLIQAKLADMATRLEAARLLVHHGARLLDEGRPVRFESAAAKVFASEAATRACQEAVQIHGGYGYLADYQVERYLRDAKLCEIGEGTSEVLRILIARSLPERLGLRSPSRREDRAADPAGGGA